MSVTFCVRPQECKGWAYSYTSADQAAMFDLLIFNGACDKLPAPEVSANVWPMVFCPWAHMYLQDYESFSPVFQEDKMVAVIMVGFYGKEYP
jgi:hypothetical protein